MIDAETRYLPLEKVGLALVKVAKKLPQYFQAHTIYVVMQFSVQAMFQTIRPLKIGWKERSWGQWGESRAEVFALLF